MVLPTCGACAFGARLHLRMRITERGRIWIVHYRHMAQSATGISFIYCRYCLLAGISGDKAFYSHRPGSSSAIAGDKNMRSHVLN